MSRAVIIASHRRSGTHLMLDSLRANARDVQQRTMTLDRIEPSHPKHLPLAEFDRRLRSKRHTVLVKTHGLPDQRAWQTSEAAAYATELVAAAPVILVHRDGRDVLVSLYHYLATFSPSVAEKSIAQFIRARRSSPDASARTLPAYWQYHVLSWLDAGPRAVAGFDELTTAFEPTIRDVADRVGLRLRRTITPVTLGSRPRPAERVRRVLRRSVGVSVPRRSTAIRPRSGVSGRWRDEFAAADAALFHAEAGEALRRLGYT
jgi:hypothetical protein